MEKPERLVIIMTGFKAKETPPQKKVEWEGEKGAIQPCKGEWL
jgi:hypothetical protein